MRAVNLSRIELLTRDTAETMLQEVLSILTELGIYYDPRPNLVLLPASELRLKAG